MNPTDSEILERARFLVEERRGPFDQREQRTIATAAALIGATPANEIDRLIRECARKLSITSSGREHDAKPTPFDLQVHDANEALREAQRAERVVRDAMITAQVKLHQFGEKTMETDEHQWMITPRMNPKPGEVARAWEAYRERQAEWRIAVNAVADARAKLTRAAKRRDFYRFNPQPAA